MDLRDYVRVLRKSWALILAITVVGIALGVGLTLATTKIYQASSQIFVSSNNGGTSDTTNGLAQGNTFITARVQSYTSLATSPQVLDPVVIDPSVVAAWKAAGRTVVTKTVDVKNGGTTTTQKVPAIDLSGDALASKISADAPLNKVLINLHVTDQKPAVAAALCNALTSSFNAQVPKTEQDITYVDGSGKTKTVTAVQLATIHPATVPSSPIKPNKILNIGLGLVLGLFIGIGVAVVREVLDNTVKTAQDFEELGIPLLAQVAFDKRAARSVIAFRSDAHSARSEAYRQLRTNLQFVDVDNPPRIIAVTSAVPGEGKSTTAINLAAALAEAGSRVCLIEADLRRPSIAKALGLVSDVGFTTVVIGKAPIETVLQNAGRNLAVLTCGPIPPNPSELLISQHAKQVILDIAEKVDYTIIDTPPLLPVTDGAEMATIADATLLVHRAARTTRDQAARSLEALEKVGRRPVGVVLNMVTRGGGSKYDYEYGYYYSSYRPSTSAAKTDNGDKPADRVASSDKKAAQTRNAAASAADRGSSAVAVADEPAAADADKSGGDDATARERLGRRARHRGRRAERRPGESAAQPAGNATAVAQSPDDAETATFPVVGVNGAHAPQETAEPVQEHTDDPSVAAEPVEATAAVVHEEPAAVEAGTTEAADNAPVEDAVSGSLDDDDYDEDDDEYDDDYDEDDFILVPSAEVDDTGEIEPVQADGQEQLPLEQRETHEIDQDALNEALGVRSEDRR